MCIHGTAWCHEFSHKIRNSTVSNQQKKKNNNNNRLKWDVYMCESVCVIPICRDGFGLWTGCAIPFTIIHTHTFNSEIGHKILCDPCITIWMRFFFISHSKPRYNLTLVIRPGNFFFFAGCSHGSQRTDQRRKRKIPSFKFNSLRDNSIKNRPGNAHSSAFF